MAPGSKRLEQKGFSVPGGRRRKPMVKKALFHYMLYGTKQEDAVQHDSSAIRSNLVQVVAGTKNHS
jgi:hypothetical protein